MLGVRPKGWRNVSTGKVGDPCNEGVHRCTGYCRILEFLAGIDFLLGAMASEYIALGIGGGDVRFKK